MSNSLVLAGGRFTAHRVPEGLRWDANFVLDVDATFDFRGGDISFALPLPPDERLVPTPGIEAIIENGRLVGLRVSKDALVDRSVTAAFLQPNTSTLGAPVTASESLQIIDSAAGDARIELARSDDFDRHFQKHIGYVAPSTVSAAAREEARRLVGVAPRMSTNMIYVRAQDVRASGLLHGQLVDPPAHSRKTPLAVGAVFVALVALLVLAARRLRTAAAVERADAMLASEIDAVAKSR